MLPRIFITVERWKKNAEYGVWVSTQGRVKLIKNKEILTPRVNSSGYWLVFTDKGPEFVHRLVAYTWLGGKRNSKYNVDHIDNNKRNNSIRNLRWIERELNTEYSRYVSSGKTDVIDSIEKTEDGIADLSRAHTHADRAKILRQLVDSGDAILWANTTPITKIEDLPSVIGKLDCDMDVCLSRIVSSMNLHKDYRGYTWKIEPKGA